MALDVLNRHKLNARKSEKVSLASLVGVGGKCFNPIVVCDGRKFVQTGNRPRTTKSRRNESD